MTMMNEAADGDAAAFAADLAPMAHEAECRRLFR
jgi:urease accessory protein UreF